MDTSLPAAGGLTARCRHTQDEQGYKMLPKEEKPRVETQRNTLETRKGETVGDMSHLYSSQAQSTLGRCTVTLGTKLHSETSQTTKVFRHFES